MKLCLTGLLCDTEETGPAPAADLASPNQAPASASP